MELLHNFVLVSEKLSTAFSQLHPQVLQWHALVVYPRKLFNKSSVTSTVANICIPSNQAFRLPILAESIFENDWNKLSPVFHQLRRISGNFLPSKPLVCCFHRFAVSRYFSFRLGDSFSKPLELFSSRYPSTGFHRIAFHNTPSTK